ncbi:MAG: DUF4139 domain-containing protein [Myxococcota bacterium]
MKTAILRCLPLCLLLTACGERRTKLPSTESPLDLERVVLYRNGVGYFERHGDVEEDILRVRVRRDQVDDLLKSLTVIDENGRALSVSMPLDPESWASAALSTLAPGRGSLAQVLDGLRGTTVVLHTSVGRISGRIVMVERLVDEPDPDRRVREDGRREPSRRDFKVTLLDGDRLKVVRLSKVTDVTLADGDLAMQLHRRLDASAGEGMFQQVEVAIRLAGADTHNLRVSYVVAAPMWKPTYRVVLPAEGNGTALLQGWAVVDNTSGEDWTKVNLALTSGEPIAFEYDLHTPRTVGRADLTETGVRKRAVVAVGETTWDDDDEEGEIVSEEEAVLADEDNRFGATAGEDRSRGRRMAEKKAKSSVASRTQPAPASAPMGGAASLGDSRGPADTGVAQDALRRSTQASARAQQVSGQTRFELQDEVTVPNGSSTMVAILNQDVEAEQTFLFRPGGAGVGYESNPYRVVRFKNTTGFVLEPGPISIYAGGSFVGEGLSEAVGAATSATIPFAVEPSILVSSTLRHHGGEMQILRVVRGVLEVENFSRAETTWTVRGRDKSGYTVLVRQGKSGANYELKDAPKTTETLPNAYLIPVKVPKGKLEGTLKVVEETPSRTTLTIWDGRATKLLDTLLVRGALAPEMRKKLQPVVDLRREYGKIDTQIAGLRQQKAEADQRLNETRQNLEAIKKDPAATALRKKLSKRMDDFSKQGDALSRQIVELQSTRLEKKIELEDLLENLDVRAESSRDKKKKPE